MPITYAISDDVTTHEACVRVQSKPNVLHTNTAAKLNQLTTAMTDGYHSHTASLTQQHTYIRQRQPLREIQFLVITRYSALQV